MKTLFLLGAMIGVALALSSCANQNSSATRTNNSSRVPSEAGLSGTGGGGGGGGPAMMRKEEH